MIEAMIPQLGRLLGVRVQIIFDVIASDFLEFVIGRRGSGADTES
jgi:hypothetical protein